MKCITNLLIIHILCMALCGIPLYAQQYPHTTLDLTPKVSSDQVEQVLSRLDKAIACDSDYFARREAQLAKLAAAPQANAADSARHMLDMAYAYAPYCLEYALNYATKGRKMASRIGDQTLIDESSITLVDILPQAGFFNESIDILERIDTVSLSPQLRTRLYCSAEHMYHPMLERYRYHPDFMSHHLPNWQKYKMLAERQLSKSSPDVQLMTAHQYYHLGDYRATIISALDVLRSLQTNSIDDQNLNPLYQDAARIIADSYHMRGRKRECTYYLALAALSQVKRGDREGCDLNRLGNYLYQQGDIDRAHRYLSAAIKAAPYRTTSLKSNILLDSVKNMNQSYNDKWDKNRKLNWSIVALLAAGAVMLAVQLMSYRRSLHRYRTEHARATQSNMAKDEFMKNFLDLGISTTKKLTDFNRLAIRKIAANQVSDLYDITRSGKILDESRKEFFAIFDRSFLNVYPSFFKELNTLLRPDEQINPQEGHLSPEIRVYALIRLGIDDVGRIAEVLGYSVNTIYVYKAKIKGKAKDRDNFDTDFMKIGAVE